MILVVLMVAVLWAMDRPKPKISVVRAKHILIKYDIADPDDRARALDMANELRDKILSGESFSRLAKRYSNDTFSSARGGDLGYQKKGTFSRAFEDYVWKAKLNQHGGEAPSDPGSRGF